MPTSPLPTWHLLASPESTVPHQPASGLQDRITVFEYNHEQTSERAGVGIDASCNSTTADPMHFRIRTRRKWCSSSNIVFNISSDERDQEEEEEEEEAEMISSRQSRTVNQELNKQLRIKADELERIFIEHKRRIDNKDCATSSNVSDGNSVTRGKLYERYMEKREAKRRNEWGVNREGKDTEMRAMWEAIEMARATMNAMRKKDKVQQTISLTEEEEDRQSSDGSLKSVKSKMLNSRSMPSTSTRLSGFSSIPKPPCKPPNSRSLRIPSTPSSDGRKENMKPSIGTVPRSKRTSSKTDLVKEEKPFLKKGNGIAQSTSKLRTNSVSHASEIVGYGDSLDAHSSPSSSKDGSQARKKWGSAKMNEVVVGDHHKDIGSKGFKRLLSFGRRSGRMESKVGDDCYDREVGFSFSEGMTLPEPVTTPRKLVPASANFKLRKDHLSESSPKSPHNFFSLSSFRNKGVESKLR